LSVVGITCCVCQEGDGINVVGETEANRRTRESHGVPQKADTDRPDAGLEKEEPWSCCRTSRWTRTSQVAVSRADASPAQSSPAESSLGTADLVAEPHIRVTSAHGRESRPSSVASHARRASPLVVLFSPFPL